MEHLKGFMYHAIAKCEKNYHFLTKTQPFGTYNTAIGSVGLDNVQFLFKHYNNSVQVTVNASLIMAKTKFRFSIFGLFHRLGV